MGWLAHGKNDLDPWSTCAASYFAHLCARERVFWTMRQSARAPSCKTHLRQRSRWDRHELNTSTPWSCKNGRDGSECGGSAETARRSVGTHCAENSRAILQDPNAARHDAFGDQLGREEICVRGAEHKRCLLRLCPSWLGQACVL
jgi:hypothetical protein